MKKSNRFRVMVPLEEEVLRMVDYIRYPNNCQFFSISPPLYLSIPSVSSSISLLTFYPLVNWIDLLPLHHLPTLLPNTCNVMVTRPTNHMISTHDHSHDLFT